MPHAVKDDDRTILSLAERPFVVEINDLGDMRTPQNAMTRGNQFDVESVQSLECRLRLSPIEEEDVRVVLLCLLDDDGEIILIVIAFAGGKVLAKGVVREEDLFLGAVRHHAVRPVEHRGRDKRERALADGERVARLDRFVGQFTVVGAQPFQSVRCARDDLRVRCKRGDERHAVRVIRLDVVRDDVVNLRWVNDRGDAREHFLLEAALDRVDEGDLFVYDEVGIVGRTALRVVAVKAAHRPVDSSDPVDIVPDFYGVHRLLLSTIESYIKLIAFFYK